MTKSLSAHIRIVEKLPAPVEALGFFDPLIPRSSYNPLNASLGVKWLWRGTWYGFWGEYAPGKRLRAYLLLVYYFFKFVLIRRWPEISEGVDPGWTFLVT